MNPKLKEILLTMDIPSKRIETNDLNWLERNLFIRNSKHPEFNRAIEMIMDELLQRAMKK